MSDVSHWLESGARGQRNRGRAYAPGRRRPRGWGAVVRAAG